MFTITNGLISGDEVSVSATYSSSNVGTDIAVFSITVTSFANSSNLAPPSTLKAFAFFNSLAALSISVLKILRLK